MASLALLSPSPWPRMRSDLENPFQNAPGPFIYALPNLAGSCPFPFSDTIADCSLAGPTSPHPQDHNCHCHYHPVAAFSSSLSSHNHCHHPPSKRAGSPSSTDNADPGMSPQSPLDEGDSDGDGDTSSSLTECGEELRAKAKKHEQQLQPRSGSSTPTPSHVSSSSSPVGSEFSEEKDSEKGEGERKRKRGRRGRRKGGKNRAPPGHGGCVMGPRAMGIPGMHFQQWSQNPWFPAAYYGTAATEPCPYGGGQVWPWPSPPPVVPGFIGLPSW
ncbi:hypothetical protein BJV74DRAFT_798624 [Russula compacta]|nr:hypothetical protein BJV74DRAFT_798624 [Russula compacta]